MVHGELFIGNSFIVHKGLFPVKPILQTRTPIPRTKLLNV